MNTLSIELDSLINVLDSKVTIPTIDKFGYAIELYSPVNAIFYKDAVITIPSRISLKIPEGYVAQLLPAGLLAIQDGLICPASLIPSGYTSEISLSFLNTTTNDYMVKEGDKLAQLIIIPALRIL